MGNKKGISIIADRYAIALIELADKNNSLDQFNYDLAAINSVFKENKDISLFLAHPTIPVDEKKALIKKVFEGAVSEYIINFLMILIDRNRFALLLNIYEHYNLLLNKKRNIVVAKVTTAINIDEEIINNLRHKLEQKFNGLNMQISTEINPDIIAGMIVKIGDRVIDGSIKTKIENMKKQLI